MDILKTIKRLCQANNCADCPLSDENGSVCLFQAVPCYWGPRYIIETTKKLEEWSKSNPVKTRGSVFFDSNPNAKRCNAYPNVPDVRPCDYDESIHYPAHCCCSDTCEDCRKNYWEEPVE